MQHHNLPPEVFWRHLRITESIIPLAKDAVGTKNAVGALVVQHFDQCN